ncbi:MAG TPA: hypothetical protein VGK90_03905 [Rhizomicrobium sp.]|jgi:hypothetical protein
MSDSVLQNIHRLQRVDITAANASLLRFLNEDLELPFEVASVEIRSSAVSLNSINGVLDTNAGKKFFKTHIEPASLIGEYYNVKLLQDAGYPIIAPVFASTVYGKQFLIYDWFEASSLFECIRAIETGAGSNENDLPAAARESDERLAELYVRSLRMMDAATHAKQPIHQLFLHRLAGKRYSDFYGGDFITPNHHLRFAEIAAKSWIVNGVKYRDTLQTMIATAIGALSFSGVEQVPVVIGHGDAHGGNLFYFGPDRPLTYFDPAFAGRHSPLLDIIKPLIHDYCLKWLYFPDEVARRNTVAYRVTGDTITVDYDFSPSRFRLNLFESKLARVITPMLARLKTNNMLAQNWQTIMQAAAMCCPLLTMNLSDRTRFTAEIALLGLAMAVELGGCAANPQHPGWFEQRLREAAPR